MAKDWKDYLEYLNKRDIGVCIWKPVFGFEDRFLISTKGDVFSLRKFMPMKITKLPNGYYYLPIMLQKPYRHTKTAYLHRLVAKTFLPNPLNKRTVNHKDGDKSNNNVANLEWATQSEQNFHATRILKVRRNIDKIQALNKAKRIFSKDEVHLIRDSGMSDLELWRYFGKGSTKAIRQIRMHKTYKDVL